MLTETIKKILFCIATFQVIHWIGFFGTQEVFGIMISLLITLMAAVLEGDVKI